MSYHDLYITTKDIPRTSIFNLPFNYMIMCTRTGGWELWNTIDGIETAKFVAGEYGGEDWLLLDNDGTEILNSRNNNELCCK